MKKTNILRATIVALSLMMFWACTNTITDSIRKEESIDYKNCIEEQLTPLDQKLFDNLDFQDGVVSCQLGLNDALKQGISKKKYNCFLEYVKKKNEEFDKLLDSNTIIAYKGKIFARNKTLYQYVDTNSVQTRANNRHFSTSIKLTAPMGSGTVTEHPLIFNGPTCLTLSRTGSNGVVSAKEVHKNISVALADETSVNIIKGTLGEIPWYWQVSYRGPSMSVTTFSITGETILLEDLPEYPDLNLYDIYNPRHPRYWNNLPSWVKVNYYYNYETNDKCWYICFESSGKFAIEAFEEKDMTPIHIRNNIYEYYGPTWKTFAGPGCYRLNLALDRVWLLVVYIQKYKEEYEYIGDIVLPKKEF